jgi:hypothetical protein
MEGKPPVITKAQDLVRRTVKLKTGYVTNGGRHFGVDAVLYCSGVFKSDRLNRVNLALTTDKRKVVIGGAWARDCEIIAAWRNPPPVPVMNPGAWGPNE